MKGWDDSMKCFSPRHEVSTIELFFDLWFVGTLISTSSTPFPGPRLIGSSKSRTFHPISCHHQPLLVLVVYRLLHRPLVFMVPHCMLRCKIHLRLSMGARMQSDSVCSFAAFAFAGYKFMPLAPDADTATPNWVRCYCTLSKRFAHRLRSTAYYASRFC